MSRHREIRASAQMRDRIAAMLEQEAEKRDRRTIDQRRTGLPAPSRTRLLQAMARCARAIPAQIAHGPDDPEAADAATARTPAEMQEIIRKVTS